MGELLEQLPGLGPEDIVDRRDMIVVVGLGSLPPYPAANPVQYFGLKVRDVHIGHAAVKHEERVELELTGSLADQGADDVHRDGRNRPAPPSEAMTARMVAAIELGFPQKAIADTAFATELAVENGAKRVVGVNCYQVDDDTAALLSHEIAREIEGQLEYPGQIKVTVIRESRSVDVAH